MNRIEELLRVGQSIWLDYIERGMVQSGELEKLVADGIRGVTSNPTIFQQAISSSPAYEADLRDFLGDDLPAKSVFERLAIADIQAAADILRSVYATSDRRDGYVSIEVAPDLANQAEATVAEARRLFASVDRPNVMIKVPATQEGVVAIRQLIEDGINVNVTLIFGLVRYQEVKQAYLAGLEARLSNGQPIDHIASVASFFVSRVDSNVDARLLALGSKGNPALLGKIAVANAKLAYRQFQQVFSGKRWQRLYDAGAQFQRPLWASTSTKNPGYPELLYVETLMGLHTVNTMPPKTLAAFRDHGVVVRSVEADVQAAENAIADLAAVGISLDEITAELEVEGVKKFADSYDDLLAAIETQRTELSTAN